mgnify:CR=1 FL=1
MLLANLYTSMQPSDKIEAVQRLHDKTFSSYKTWLKILPTSKRSKEDERLEAARTVEKDMVKDIVTWWCIWGEAANLRFMPELISWLHYKLANAETPERREGGDFLRLVVQPLYDMMKKEFGKKDKAGMPAKHTDIKNYDDINEFFWPKRCIEAEYQPFAITVLVTYLKDQHKKTYMVGIVKSIPLACAESSRMCARRRSEE